MISSMLENDITAKIPPSTPGDMFRRATESSGTSVCRPADRVRKIDIVTNETAKKSRERIMRSQARLSPVSVLSASSSTGANPPSGRVSGSRMKA